MVDLPDADILHTLYQEASTRRHTADKKQACSAVSGSLFCKSCSTSCYVQTCACFIRHEYLFATLQADLLANEQALRDSSKLGDESAVLMSHRLSRQVQLAFQNHCCTRTGSGLPSGKA